MTELFGTEYFGFIASAYGVVTIVLLALLVWVNVTYSQRKSTLERLEQAGIKRASKSDG